jgi:hypothetical protein
VRRGPVVRAPLLTGTARAAPVATPEPPARLVPRVNTSLQAEGNPAVDSLADYPDDLTTLPAPTTAALATWPSVSTRTQPQLTARARSTSSFGEPHTSW